VVGHARRDAVASTLDDQASNRSLVFGPEIHRLLGAMSVTLGGSHHRKFTLPRQRRAQPTCLTQQGLLWSSSRWSGPNHNSACLLGQPDAAGPPYSWPRRWAERCFAPVRAEIKIPRSASRDERRPPLERVAGDRAQNRHGLLSFAALISSLLSRAYDDERHRDSATSLQLDQ